MSQEASRAPCPITKLPCELREMIFDYYFEGMETKCAKLYKPQFGDCLDENEEWSMWQLPGQTNNFQPLKPYFSMLHFSSGVRFETDMEICDAAFSGVWFNFELDSDTNGISRMKAMFAQIRNTNKTVKFGLHFTVCDHTRETFFHFIDSFFDIHTTGDNWAPAFVRCKEDGEARRSMHLSDKQHAGIQYTYKSMSKEYHRLWMFGNLTRLDWSKFEFKVPPPLLTRSRFVDSLIDDPTHISRRKEKHNKASTDDVGESYTSDGDGIDLELDSENEVVALNSDDDDGAMHFDGGDKGPCYDDGDEGSLRGSEDESGGSESVDKVDLLDDEDEDHIWIDIEL